MMKILLRLLVISLFLNSCKALQETAKQGLQDGYYKNDKDGKVYVQVEEENIQIYQTIQKHKELLIDTLTPMVSYLAKSKIVVKRDFTLTKGGIDLDFLVMPAKLRFATKDVPAQLNSEFNGFVYLGFRQDRYKLNYQTNPLHISERNIAHVGYSIGLVNGTGNTFISPTTTNNAIQQEYDGLVWSKGVSAIVGVNNISIGLMLGFDNLLDKNNKLWIYENKPWIGLGFGLNLN